MTACDSRVECVDTGADTCMARTDAAVCAAIKPAASVKATNPICRALNFRLKKLCSNKKAPRENGAAFRSLSREGLGQIQAGAGVLTFGPSVTAPRFSARNFH